MAVTIDILNQALDKSREHFSNQLKDHQQRIDERFKEVDHKLENVVAMFRNSHASAGWADIQPVQLFDATRQPGSQNYVPTDFPNKVVKFWRLSDERNRAFHCHHNPSL